MFKTCKSNLEKAKTTLREAYDRRCLVLGKQDKSTLRTCIRLGEVYQKMGNLPQAAECFREVYQIRLETLGAEHADTIAIKEKLDSIATC